MQLYTNITGANNGTETFFFLKKTSDGYLTAVRGTHLSDIFKVIVSFLQGSSSMKGLPNACVLAEEGLAVVFYPVHHLEETVCAEITFF